MQERLADEKALEENETGIAEELLAAQREWDNHEIRNNVSEIPAEL